MTTFSRRYEGPDRDVQDSLSLDTGGRAEKLRKAEKKFIAEMHDFAESPANSYREYQEEASVNWRGLAWGFLGTLTIGFLVWVGWQFGHLLKFLVGW